MQRRMPGGARSENVGIGPAGVGAAVGAAVAAVGGSRAPVSVTRPLHQRRDATTRKGDQKRMKTDPSAPSVQTLRRPSQTKG